MFNKLKSFFKRKKEPTIKNVSLTLTDATCGEDKMSDIDQELKAVHTKIYTNPRNKLSISEINLLMERDLKLQPLTSGFFNFNKSMVDITLLEFSSINIVYDKDNDIVRGIEYTFIDALNGTDAKLIVPAEAISELLVPVIFKKDPVKC